MTSAYYHGIFLSLMLFCVTVVPASSKPVTQHQKYPCWCGKKIAVVTLLYDDEISEHGDLSGMLTYCLGRAGIPTVTEAEEADWILVPTAGKLSSSSGGTSYESMMDISRTLQFAPTTATATSRLSSAAKTGVLLSLYKASDWEELTNSGKIPTPIWVDYHEINSPLGSTQACPILIYQGVLDLLLWNGGKLAPH
jgi:hypothetical protein